MSDLPLPPPDLLRDASLFLDFDGTLVEIAETPDAVRVDPALPALLTRLSERMQGRVAIVSGRPADEVRALLAPAELPVAGSHGLEIVDAAGSVTAPSRPEGLDAALAAAAAWRDRFPGVLVEDKPFGVGLHFRGAPEAADEAEALARRLADEHGLTIQHGKMIVELRLPGHDKGGAVSLLMAEPLRRHTRPVFIGDDVTDEAGFVAADALDGAGILVGAWRDTAATYRLACVADTLAWLDVASREI
jgi:trehalose 6-phosphate phosphatase